ncbi:hypothetical protein QTO34_014102 [Cnephaeus nilssonii]|uniref:Uncharacterized protein n=1 Tax=Cnephaeus nilssonii TaxID=3371016 RepID=A0AA40LTM5_CNENI|nr:hypothetical protein QTO34_014102 [Eptesicus nilssonii]
MQTFVTQQWKQSKDKPSCLHGKKLSERKVKSPLHLFSTLRSSLYRVSSIRDWGRVGEGRPGRPATLPRLGKSKAKLKAEQDGISKTHKLLRRTCAGAPKAEDGAPKAHRPFGRSLSSDPGPSRP